MWFLYRASRVSRAYNVYSIPTARDLTSHELIRADEKEFPQNYFSRQKSQFKMSGSLDKTQIAACAAVYIIMLGGDYLKGKLVEKEKRKSCKERRYWMHEIYKSRARYNATDLLEDLKRGPSNKFQTSVECLPQIERLAVTLRFLATGDSFKSLSYLFKFSSKTIYRCVQDVCKALNQELKNEIMV
ncbi:protein ANTAGONIST OF LIKE HETEROCHROMATIN PROTEIN 1-like, partial [Aphis craccivora]